MEDEKPQVVDYTAVIADLEKKRDELDRTIALLKLTVLGYPAGIGAPATAAATTAQPTVTSLRIGRPRR